MPKTLLAFDLETTGLSPTEDRIIEYGIILWDLVAHRMLDAYSLLVNPGIEVPARITAMVGLTTEQLERRGYPPEAALRMFAGCLRGADIIAGHNMLNFDIPFLHSESERTGVTLPWLERHQYIDTRYDAIYHPDIWGRTLVEAIKSAGLTNPYAHRGIFDALMVAEVVDQNLEAILAKTKYPIVTIQAEVTYPNRLQAQQRKYYWDKTQKAWVKQVRRCDLEAEQTALPFPIKEITHV